MNDKAKRVLESDIASSARLYRRRLRDLRQVEAELGDQFQRARRNKGDFTIEQLAALSGLNEDEAYRLESEGYVRMAQAQDAAPAEQESD